MKVLVHDSTVLITEGTVSVDGLRSLRRRLWNDNVRPAAHGGYDLVLTADQARSLENDVRQERRTLESLPVVGGDIGRVEGFRIIGFATEHAT